MKEFYEDWVEDTTSSTAINKILLGIFWDHLDM